MQLRLELFNIIRSNEALNRSLFSDFALNRSVRSQLHQITAQVFSDIVDNKPLSLNQEERKTKFVLINSWRGHILDTTIGTTSDEKEAKEKKAESQSNYSRQLQQGFHKQEVAAVDRREDKKLNGFSNLSFAELRAILLSKYDPFVDNFRSFLPGTEKALPASTLAKLCHSICIDMQDSNLSLSSQSLCAGALMALIEWVDKLLHCPSVRSPSANLNLPGVYSAGSRFLDAKDAVEIYRRMLETATARLRQIKKEFPQVSIV